MAQKMVRIENRGRQKHRFEKHKRIEKPGRRPQLVIDRKATVVLGSSEDRNRAPTIDTPSPVWELTKEAFDALPPKQKALIATMVSRGEFDLREFTL